MRSSALHGPPLRISARMSSFSAAPMPSRPKYERAPSKLLPAGVPSPLVLALNSVNRSRMRSGIGQPRTR